MAARRRPRTREDSGVGKTGIGGDSASVGLVGCLAWCPGGLPATTAQHRTGLLPLPVFQRAQASPAELHPPAVGRPAPASLSPAPPLHRLRPSAAGRRRIPRARRRRPPPRGLQPASTASALAPRQSAPAGRAGRRWIPRGARRRRRGRLHCRVQSAPPRLLALF